MSRQRLFVIHGMGRDEVGLVGRITAPLADAGGNVVDLRQDVLHGLFTIYLVLDLSDSQLDQSSLEALIADIGQDTGLRLTVDRYQPVPRSAEKTNLLVICVGRDKPGIIASSSEMLSKYNANIELSQCIGREGIFLMELITDVSQVTIPVENLKRTLQANMQALNIATVFQDEHVFVKRKRVIVFAIRHSLIDRETVDEIVAQAGLTPESLAVLSGTSPVESLARAAERLDGLPAEVVERVLGGVKPTSGSRELVQTLKVMGYRVALVTTAFDFVAEHLRKELDLDHAVGVPCECDDDARVLTGELPDQSPLVPDLDEVTSRLASQEHVDANDVAVIEDDPAGPSPGIRLEIDLEVLLGCLNKHAVSTENLIGLLGSFGLARVS